MLRYIYSTPNFFEFFFNCKDFLIMKHQLQTKLVEVMEFQLSYFKS